MLLFDLIGLPATTILALTNVSLKTTQGVFMSFNLAVAGLNAAHKRLEVAGNNIANVGTTGFKSSRAEFSAVYSSSHLGGSGTAVGDGVRLDNVSQDFSAGGSNSSSGRALDMRIQGSGFFVVSDRGALSYTRSGEFSKDAADYVVDSQGSRLQGYAVNAKGEVVNGVHSDLKIDTGNMAPKATTEVVQTLNLDSSAPSLAALADFKADDPRTYTRMTTQTIMDKGVPEVKEQKGKDSDGNEVIVVQAKAAVPPQPHELRQYFVKLDDNSWTSYILIDGVNPLDPSTLSPLQVGLQLNGEDRLAMIGPHAALKKVSDTELSLSDWRPAIKVNGGWTPSGADNDGPINLSLVEGSGPLLSATDAVMPRPVPVFDPKDPATFSKVIPNSLFDSLGARHELTQYYVKDGNNSWRLHVLVDGRNPQDPASTTPLSANMLFAADGSVQSLVGGPGLVAANGKLTLTGWVPAQAIGAGRPTVRWVPSGAVANADGITLDMTHLTQHRAETARSSVLVDGHAPGEINKLSVDKDGVISAGFSNGLHRKIGQVMLASFANEQGLRPVSDTRWEQTGDSGEPNYDAPGTGRLGGIVANSLEGSNVDLTQELVELIQAQTAYQANSKTLSTEAEVMQTLIRAT
jgi:flagellar hook protein FlgE